MVIKISKKVFEAVGRFICKIIFCRTKVIGQENIPKEGGILFCSNHKTAMDPIIIQYYSTRDIRFMAKAALNNFLLRPIIKMFNVILVKRNSKDFGAVKEALGALENGECVGIFPEGTRNGLVKNNGKMRNGATYLALKSNVKIVPIGIKGKVGLFRKTIITFGTPIDYSKYQGEKVTKLLEEKTTEELKNTIIELTK